MFELVLLLASEQWLFHACYNIPYLCSDVTNGETRSVPISSTEAVPSFSVPSSSDVTNSETKSVPISSNVALLSLPVPSTSDVTNSESRSVPISSTETVPPLSLPSSSDITNGETRSVTISSKAAAPSLSVPSSRAPTNVKTKRQQAYRIISASDPSWADLFKTPDATNRSSTESDAARRDQLQESALLIPNPPQSSAFPVNQPMDTTRQQSTATASSPPGLRPTISMADLNSFFSSAGFQQRSGSNSYTLAHDGDMTNLHYLWRQEQNNVPSSEALQQRGGTNNDTSLYHSLDSVFSQYRNNSLPPSATSSDVTSGTAANSSGASSIGPSSHASAYSVGMPSGNAAPWSGSIPRVHLPSSNSSGGTSSIGPSSSHVNGSNSRLGYGDYLPPVHLQGSRSSNEWTVQSEEIYFIPSHWRSPGYRPSQQEREEYRGIGYERLRAYNASLNQENNTSDPSDQTQQRPRDK
ncbi:flocculation protein FLO11 [Raphanus sativus]|uniref:Flocculation protein FLO11 n=1 Tax=Raphanus sativus TaxID=3726 RepID=A0A9W3DJB1_RAPSA|nr:flocculation protein FLO11 [Raphanus sativus]